MRGHLCSNAWLKRGRTLRRYDACGSSRPGHLLQPERGLGWPRQSRGSTLALLGSGRSSLWVTQAVPVSFTLAPGPAVEKPPDEVLGLFLHCRFGAGECEGQSPPCRAPRGLLAWQCWHLPLLPGQGLCVKECDRWRAKALNNSWGQRVKWSREHGPLPCPRPHQPTAATQGQGTPRGGAAGLSTGLRPPCGSRSLHPHCTQVSQARGHLPYLGCKLALLVERG